MLIFILVVNSAADGKSAHCVLLRIWDRDAMRLSAEFVGCNGGLRRVNGPIGGA